MTAAYFEEHPTDPEKMILRKPSMMWEGSLHIVCQCDKCKAQPQRTWVGLTDDDKVLIKHDANFNQFMTAGEYADRVQELTEARLKDKNNV
jgi:hypothetical protein